MHKGDSRTTANAAGDPDTTDKIIHYFNLESNY
jgi:hypothetical protein